MNIFYVYKHIIKNTGEVFYVGKGCKTRAYNLKERNKYHQRITKKYEIIIEFIEKNLSEDESFELERKTITHYKSIGMCKANFGFGGKGRSLGFKLSEESKNKLRLKNLGKKHTKCTKLKMSKTRMGHYVSPETKQKLKMARLGKVTEEHKQKIRDKNGGKSASHWTGWVITPFGIFETDRIAAKVLKTSRNTIKAKIASDHYPEWRRSFNV